MDLLTTIMICSMFYSNATVNAMIQTGSTGSNEIGIMQIPNFWLKPLSDDDIPLESLSKPCKNVAVATDILNHAETHCATLTETDTEREACTLSIYKTGDPKAGLEYANKILTYAQTHPMTSASPHNQQQNFKAHFLKKPEG